MLVNYNSGPRIGPLLDLLEPEVSHVVVVDNASVDGSLAAAEGRQHVTVVRNSQNRGFAAAANQGAAASMGEWLLFVNPDVALRPGQVTALLSEVPPSVGAVAPLQVDERDRPRPETGGYQPTLRRYLVWALVPVRFHRRSGPWLAPPYPAGDVPLDWVSGALLGIPRGLFERLGGFDETFFLYHEDVDLGRRIREAGQGVLCRGGIRLHHEVAHGDPDRRVASGLRSIESLALAFPGGWRRRAIGLVLGMGYSLRAMFGSGTGQALARAALPHCRTLIGGRLPTRTLPGGPAERSSDR